MRLEVFYTGPFFVQWPQQNLHLYDLKMIIGSVLTAEPNWHEAMLLSFCPNNIASATQVYLDFAIALRPWLVGKKTVGKKAPWWGSISWNECRRHLPGPPPPSPPKPILTCLGYRGFEPFVFAVFTTTRDWWAGQAARTSWIFCRGPCYPNPCRVVLSNMAMGRTFQGCATRRPWALTPSLQVLKNTQVCDSSKVENDAVGEEEATHRASEAAMQYAARRVEARGFPATDLAAYEASGSSGKQDVKRARLDWIHRACDMCRIRRKRARSVATIFGTKQHMSLMCALMRYLSLGHVRFSVGTRALVGFLRWRCSTTNEKGACARACSAEPS